MGRFGGGLLKWCCPGGAAWINGMVFFAWVVLCGFRWVIWGGGVRARGQGHLLVLAGRVGQCRFVLWS